MCISLILLNENVDEEISMREHSKYYEIAGSALSMHFVNAVLMKKLCRPTH